MANLKEWILNEADGEPIEAKERTDMNPELAAIRWAYFFARSVVDDVFNAVVELQRGDQGLAELALRRALGKSREVRAAIERVLSAWCSEDDYEED